MTIGTIHWMDKSVAIAIETKSNPIQKFRLRPHLSELTIFKEEHVTVLSVPHNQAKSVKHRILNSYSIHRKTNICIHIQHTINLIFLISKDSISKSRFFVIFIVNF